MPKITKLFNKLPSDKKVILESVADFVIIFLLIYIMYFFLLLRPVVNSAKALSSAKSLLTYDLQLLQQDRIAHTTLISLDPEKFNFYDQVSGLLEKAKDSREKITNSADDGKISIAGTKDSKKLLKEIDAKLPEIKTEGKRIAEDKKSIYEDYQKINAILSRIFEYDPKVDLETPDVQKDREIVAERAASASKGLKDISVKLKDSGLVNEKDTVSFYEEISNNVSILDQITDSANQGNPVLTKTLINNFKQEYIKLKKEAKKVQDLPLISEKAYKLLTEETNLILKYEFYIAKIEPLQKSLNTNPLSNILGKFSR